MLALIDALRFQMELFVLIFLRDRFKVARNPA
jgi:hypothetical protein